MFQRIKKQLISRFALLSRTKKLYRFDHIWRWLLNPDKNTKSHINEILFIGNHFWHINTRSYLEWTLFFYGVYEEQIQQLFKQYLIPGDIALDVGSNIGIHTLCMAKLVGPSGIVISFEPHKDIYTRQVNNLTLNQATNVKALQIGLSNKNATAFLEQFNTTESSNQGTSAIVSQHTINTLQIQVARLDDLVATILPSSTKRIKVIKVDIEGHEEAFFEGAIHTIEQHRPVIIFENSKNFLTDPSSVIKQHLSDHKYTFFGINFNSLHPINLKTTNQLPCYRVLALPNIDTKKENFK